MTQPSLKSLKQLRRTKLNLILINSNINKKEITFLATLSQNIAYYPQKINFKLWPPPQMQKNSICWWEWLHTSVSSQWNYHKWLHQFENCGKRICTSYATTPSRSLWRNKNRTIQGTDNHLLWHRPQYDNNSPMWCQYTVGAWIRQINQRCAKKTVGMASRCLTSTESRYSKVERECLAVTYGL